MMNDRMPQFTAENIRDSYGSRKAKNERYTEWTVYYIYRPLSFQVTPFFLHRGFTPSRVTLISLILVLTLPLLALLPYAPSVLVGLMAAMICVLDCVDGNIARVMSLSSDRGGYFDFLTDVIYRILLYFSIGIMMTQSPDTPALFSDTATECLLIAALLAIVARMCRVWVSSELDGLTEKTETKTTATGWLDQRLFPFFSGLDRALPFAVILFGLLGLLHWVLVWLLLYSLLDFLHTQYAIFAKLD